MTEKDICMLPDSFYFKSIYTEDTLYHAEEVKFGYRVTWGLGDETYYLTNKFHEMLLDGSFVIER